MNTFLESTGGGAWLPFLFDMSFKAMTILLLAYATTRALRAASASLRHHIWTLAFVAVLALPLVAASLPSWQVSMPGWTGSVPGLTSASAKHAVSPTDRTGGAERLTGEGLTGNERLVVTRDQAQAVPGLAPIASSRAMDGFFSRGLIRTILGLWLAGVALMLVRLGVGVVAACWTSRKADELDHTGWKRLVDELCAELRIGTPVRLLTSPAISTPMAWGIFRPALLLPSDAHSWSEDRRRAVVVHELAHVKRRDCLVHLVAQAARAVHWFNPLAWLGTTRLRAERERACDDLVLASGTRSADYAKLLLDVARGRMDRSLGWATVSMARPSELEGRLLAILDPARDRSGMGRPAAVAAIGLAAGVMLPLAAFQAAPEPPAPPASLEPLAEPGAPPGPNPGSLPLAFEPPADRASQRPLARRPLARPQPVPMPRPAPTPRVIEGAPFWPSAGWGGFPDGFERLATAADTLEERAAAAMVRALRSDNASIRSQAAHTLGSLESTLGVDPLSESVREDENAAVRRQAAWALGMIGSADGVTALLPALRDESPRVRSQAAWALGMIERAEAVDGLVAALGSDESATVRSQAAWALGMIEDRSATGALIDAIEDRDEDVAQQAMWALGRVIG